MFVNAADIEESRLDKILNKGIEIVYRGTKVLNPGSSFLEIGLVLASQLSDDLGILFKGSSLLQAFR